MRSEIVVTWTIALALLVVGMAFFLLTTKISHQTQVYVNDQVLTARIADTPAAREKGLSGTDSLPNDQAMLFIFDGNGKWPIWMKDMLYNIDVIWLSDNKRVVDLLPNLSPDSYPKAFTPKQDARYVIELPAGYAAQHGITFGTIVDFRDSGGS